MSCECNNIVEKSLATIAIDSGNTFLLITPQESITVDNEGRVALKLTNSVPSGGATMPVYVKLNGVNVAVYDKFGNILYGYGIRNNIVFKGFFGNNGSGNTSHLQLVNYPFIRC